MPPTEESSESAPPPAINHKHSSFQSSTQIQLDERMDSSINTIPVVEADSQPENPSADRSCQRSVRELDTTPRRIVNDVESNSQQPPDKLTHTSLPETATLQEGDQSSNQSSAFTLSENGLNMKPSQQYSFDLRGNSTGDPKYIEMRLTDHHSLPDPAPQSDISMPDVGAEMSSNDHRPLLAHASSIDQSTNSPPYQSQSGHSVHETVVSNNSQIKAQSPHSIRLSKIDMHLDIGSDDEYNFGRSVSNTSRSQRGITSLSEHDVLQDQRSPSLGHLKRKRDLSQQGLKPPKQSRLARPFQPIGGDLRTSYASRTPWDDDDDVDDGDYYQSGKHYAQRGLQNPTRRFVSQSPQPSCRFGTRVPMIDRMGSGTRSAPRTMQRTPIHFSHETMLQEEEGADLLDLIGGSVTRKPSPAGFLSPSGAIHQSLPTPSLLRNQLSHADKNMANASNDDELKLLGDNLGKGSLWAPKSEIHQKEQVHDIICISSGENTPIVRSKRLPSPPSLATSAKTMKDILPPFQSPIVKKEHTNGYNGNLDSLKTKQQKKSLRVKEADTEKITIESESQKRERLAAEVIIAKEKVALDLQIETALFGESFDEQTAARRQQDIEDKAKSAKELREKRREQQRLDAEAARIIQGVLREQQEKVALAEKVAKEKDEARKAEIREAKRREQEPTKLRELIEKRLNATEQILAKRKKAEEAKAKDAADKLKAQRLNDERMAALKASQELKKKQAASLKVTKAPDPSSPNPAPEFEEDEGLFVKDYSPDRSHGTDGSDDTDRAYKLPMASTSLNDPRIHRPALVPNAVPTFAAIFAAAATPSTPVTGYRAEREAMDAKAEAEKKILAQQEAEAQEARIEKARKAKLAKAQAVEEAKELKARSKSTVQAVPRSSLIDRSRATPQPQPIKATKPKLRAGFQIDDFSSDSEDGTSQQRRVAATTVTRVATPLPRTSSSTRLSVPNDIVNQPAKSVTPILPPKPTYLCLSGPTDVSKQPAKPNASSLPPTSTASTIDGLKEQFNAINQRPSSAVPILPASTLSSGTASVVDKPAKSAAAPTSTTVPSISKTTRKVYHQSGSDDSTLVSHNSAPDTHYAPILPPVPNSYNSQVRLISEVERERIHKEAEAKKRKKPTEAQKAARRQLDDAKAKDRKTKQLREEAEHSGETLSDEMLEIQLEAYMTKRQRDLERKRKVSEEKARLHATAPGPLTLDGILAQSRALPPPPTACFQSLQQDENTPQSKALIQSAADTRARLDQISRGRGERFQHAARITNMADFDTSEDFEIGAASEPEEPEPGYQDDDNESVESMEDEDEELIRSLGASNAASPDEHDAQIIPHSQEVSPSPPSSPQTRPYGYEEATSNTPDAAPKDTRRVFLYFACQQMWKDGVARENYPINSFHALEEANEVAKSTIQILKTSRPYRISSEGYNNEELYKGAVWFDARKQNGTQVSVTRHQKSRQELVDGENLDIRMRFPEKSWWIERTTTTIHQATKGKFDEETQTWTEDPVGQETITKTAPLPGKNYTNLLDANYAAYDALKEFIKPAEFAMDYLESHENEGLPELRQLRDACIEANIAFEAELTIDDESLPWMKPYTFIKFEVVMYETAGPLN